MFRLMVHVKYIASRRNPALLDATMTLMQRAVEAALEQGCGGSELDASKGLLSLDHRQFEQIAIQILSPYSTCYDWKKDVSCPNGYGQTLAHLAATLGCIRLLEQLISWEIDLSVRDATGATALHFAYLYGHPECVSLLTPGGANQQIRGELGRKPYAMTWPNDSGASLNGTLDDLSDFTSDRATSIADREEMPGTERVSGPRWTVEKNRFDPRQANSLECGTSSVRSVHIDLDHRSPTTNPIETGIVEVQPQGYTIQGFESAETGSTIQPAAIASQGPSGQMLLPSGTLIPALPVSPSTQIPVMSPERPTPIISLSVAASLVQSPVSLPYSPRSNQTPSLSKRPVDNLLHSLLEIKQSKPPDMRPTGLVHEPPNFPPPEPYKFREMTLGCRFGMSVMMCTTIPMILIDPSPPSRSSVTTDQWLTTRVDTSWTVSQVKLHMLTKLLGARRDQLEALNHPNESHAESTSSSDPAGIHEAKAISTSNRSSVIFALQESSDLDSLNYSPSSRYRSPAWPVDRQPFDAEPSIPSLSPFSQSVPTARQAHLASETGRYPPHHGFGVATAPPVMQNLNTNSLNKEDLLDELLDRLETAAKEAVYKMTDNYCLIRFLSVRTIFMLNILHSSLPFPLSSPGLTHSTG